MVKRVATVAFEGIKGPGIDVQVQVARGLPAFNIVGLPDKAVSEQKSGTGGIDGVRSCTSGRRRHRLESRTSRLRGRPLPTFRSPSA